MPALRAKTGAAARGGNARTSDTDDGRALLEGKIRGALEKRYLKGRKVVGIKIRQAEGNYVEGFLKFGGAKGDRHLVDFRATSNPQGRLSSLEVDGRKIPLSASSAT